MSHSVYFTFSTEGSSAQLIIISELVIAVIKSWDATFHGNAADVLLMSISTSAEQWSNGVYAQLCRYKKVSYDRIGGKKRL